MLDELIPSSQGGEFGAIFWSVHHLYGRIQLLKVVTFYWILVNSPNTKMQRAGFISVLNARGDLPAADLGR
jgi:hypothetical protein